NQQDCDLRRIRSLTLDPRTHLLLPGDRIESSGAEAGTKQPGDDIAQGAEKRGHHLLRPPPPTVARGISAPRMYTRAIRLVLTMSSSGFASRTMKSALLPGAIVPRRSSRRMSAAVRVAATIASAGVRPADTIWSSSMCSVQRKSPPGRRPP